MPLPAAVENLSQPVYSKTMHRRITSPDDRERPLSPDCQALYDLCYLLLRRVSSPILVHILLMREAVKGDFQQAEV